MEDTIQDCTLNSCRLTWNYVYSLKYTDNSAVYGSVLYGGMISRCQYINSIQIQSLNSSKIDSFSHSAVSSDAIRKHFI